MSARVIDLATRRPVPATKPAAGRLPLAVHSEPDAVAMLLPGFEWWLEPDQADELADDLRRGAAEARAKRPRPRGA